MTTEKYTDRVIELLEQLVTTQDGVLDEGGAPLWRNVVLGGLVHLSEAGTQFIPGPRYVPALWDLVRLSSTHRSESCAQRARPVGSAELQWPTCRALHPNSSIMRR